MKKINKLSFGPLLPSFPHSAVLFLLTMILWKCACPTPRETTVPILLSKDYQLMVQEIGSSDTIYIPKQDFENCKQGGFHYGDKVTLISFRKKGSSDTGWKICSNLAQSIPGGYTATSYAVVIGYK